VRLDGRQPAGLPAQRGVGLGGGVPGLLGSGLAARRDEREQPGELHPHRLEPAHGRPGGAARVGRRGHGQRGGRRCDRLGGRRQQHAERAEAADRREEADDADRDPGLGGERPAGAADQGAALPGERPPGPGHGPLATADGLDLRGVHARGRLGGQPRVAREPLGQLAVVLAVGAHGVARPARRRPRRPARPRACPS
jgi:hypothetical protein